MSTPKKILLALLALVVILIVIAAAPGNGAEGMTRSTATTDPEGPVPLPENFSDKAVLELDSRCNCWVWHWADTWTVTMAVAPHSVQYRFGLDVQWRANADKTKVTGLVYNYCLDKGGYFDFTGCTKEHGATGYRSIGMYDVWHYQYKIAGWGIVHRDPSVRFDLFANGNVTGTVYYDN